MHLFGEKEIFAISYKPVKRYTTDYPQAYCHFIFGGYLIGDSEETCLLKTWTANLRSWRNRVKAYKGQLANPGFKNLTEREIFEIIIKSNQLQGDFDPAFSYLPSHPTNELWTKHYVKLDETMDGFSVVIIEDNQKLELICNGNMGSFFSVGVEYNLFFQTIDSCLKFLVEIHGFR